MARYILLEVDDNETAGDLVAALQRGDGNVFFYKQVILDEATGEDEYRVSPINGARVRGLMAKPVNFCECQPPSDNSVKGKKLGWYVCATCNKCKKGVCQHPRNLLDPIDMPPRQRQWYLGIWEPADTKPPTYGAPGNMNPNYVGKRGHK